MSNPAAIAIEDLTLRFGGAPVLRDFSLRVARGEHVTLAGHSGAGKSSILRCILGFAMPDRGAVRIEGERLSASTVWALRTRMAFVAQEPELGRSTVRAALAAPFRYRANAAIERPLDRAPGLFERLRLPASMLDQDLADLSGGEKQRVALAGALLLQRPILLADEIVSALDRDSRAAVRDVLADCDGLTVLAVAHHAEDLGLGGPVVALPRRDGEGAS